MTNKNVTTCDLIWTGSVLWVVQLCPLSSKVYKYSKYGFLIPWNEEQLELRSTWKCVFLAKYECEQERTSVECKKGGLLLEIHERCTYQHVKCKSEMYHKHERILVVCKGIPF